MKKISTKQLTQIICLAGTVMTVIAVIFSYFQTQTIIKAIKKYSPYH